MRKTLFLLAHQDDEAISCGALLALRAAIDCTRVVTLFGRKYNYGRGDQFEADQRVSFARSLKALSPDRPIDSCSYQFDEGEPASHGHYKILEVLEREMHTFDPTDVIVPSALDLNQDHRFLAELMRIVLRPASLGSVRRVLSAHGVDGGAPASMNYFVPHGREVMDQKLAAVACYAMESRDLPHPRAPANLEALHRVCGSRCGAEFAEPYTLLMGKD